MFQEIQVMIVNLMLALMIEEDDEPPILGASCGTVTPGYQNECCARKGFDRWDAEEFTCVGEREDVDEDERVGTSCGTVTPGTENQCCQRKGYSGWNPEEFECENNQSEENECEEWNCTRWSECSSEGIRTRECVKSQLNCTQMMMTKMKQKTNQNLQESVMNKRS